MIASCGLLLVLVINAVVVTESGSHRRVDCLLPPKTGPCKGSFARYYYDIESRSCKAFIYGGCGANTNNFLKRHHCEKRCRKALGRTRFFGS